MKYQVQWNYVAAFAFKPIVLEKGELVELSEDVAEFVNRDSPGCLVAYAGEGEARALDDAPQDRMMRKAKARGHDDRGKQDVIDKKTFKAVKDKEE